MNYYERLGVSKTASAEEIKSAYRRLSHEYHPDKTNGDKLKEEIFKLIAQAYSILIDPELRAIYDRQDGRDITAEEMKRLDDAVREFYRNLLNKNRAGAIDVLETIAADPAIVRRVKGGAIDLWGAIKRKILL